MKFFLKISAPENVLQLQIGAKMYLGDSEWSQKFKKIEKVDLTHQLFLEQNVGKLFFLSPIGNKVFIWGFWNFDRN